MCDLGIKYNYFLIESVEYLQNTNNFCLSLFSIFKIQICFGGVSLKYNYVLVEFVKYKIQLCFD